MHQQSSRPNSEDHQKDIYQPSSVLTATVRLPSLSDPGCLRHFNQLAVLHVIDVAVDRHRAGDKRM